MMHVVLDPITDDAEDAPEGIKMMARDLVASGVEANAGFASIRGTSDETEGIAWVLVVTAARHEGRWQIHASWVDQDEEPHEAAFGVTAILREIREGP